MDGAEEEEEEALERPLPYMHRNTRIDARWARASACISVSEIRVRKLQSLEFLYEAYTGAHTHPEEAKTAIVADPSRMISP